MTKRAKDKFERRPRDLYVTPFQPVADLMETDWLENGETFAEPCAGDGSLTEHLEALGLISLWESDIEPQHKRIKQKDALELTEEDVTGCRYIITNPPWDRQLLHPMIEHFMNLRPTILLFDSDWAHTKQAAPLMLHCYICFGVGRVSWMGNGKKGFDNCSWYLFRKEKPKRDTILTSKYIERLKNATQA